MNEPCTPTSYTPQYIDKLFIIPLYQRLFEWEERQILQLLNDLYLSCIKKEKYYIGMLTTCKYKANGIERYSLVDGQQRFTLLILMGIVFRPDSSSSSDDESRVAWDNFLSPGGKFRLEFFARKNDQLYLQNLIERKEQEYTNRKMDEGIKCIEKFIKDKFNSNTKEEDKFKKFVFEQTTFFISELPESYSLQDLNRYFEAMNEAGKGLENHEILKVILLRKVDAEKCDLYTSIWNLVSEIDKCIIKQEEQERLEDYKNRNIKYFYDCTLLKNDFVENHKINDPATDNLSTLKGIKPTQKKPKESDAERNEQAILTFTDFLLQILWLSIENKERKNATDFFNKNKLLETFDKHIGCNNNLINEFFDNLLQFRILFDYYIIRLNSKDDRNVTYSLNQVTDDCNYEAKRNLIHYQSMLYVSTDSHLWLTDFLNYLKTKEDITVENSLCHLKDWDNERINKTSVLLDYNSIQRYWFWRLDYYLWLNREDIFKTKTKIEIANNYIFRSNRSIEHIAPQHPKTDSIVLLDENLRHKFGNLAMISSGQNSSLQNESFEVKRAYVESFINQSVGGSIQSLKMLKIYDYEKWDRDNIIAHHNEMVNILIKSFSNDENKYNKIIEELTKTLITP
jgi:hypothetical protein